MTTRLQAIDNFGAADSTFYPTRAAIADDAADAVFRSARTAYAFTDEPVTPGQLEGLQDLLRHPPTAMNTQPLRVTLLASADAKERLMPHLAEGNRAKARSAPVVAILAADTDFHEFLPRLMPHAPGARERFLDDTVREQAARFNATLQSGYFILAARAVGLDAGPMGGFDAAGVDADFFAGTGLRSILVVNLGHAALGDLRPRGPRMAVDEVFTIL